MLLRSLGPTGTALDRRFFGGILHHRSRNRNSLCSIESLGGGNGGGGLGAGVNGVGFPIGRVDVVARLRDIVGAQKRNQLVTVGVLADGKAERLRQTYQMRLAKRRAFKAAKMTGEGRAVASLGGGRNHSF